MGRIRSWAFLRIFTITLPKFLALVLIIKKWPKYSVNLGILQIFSFTVRTLLFCHITDYRIGWLFYLYKILRNDMSFFTITDVRTCTSKIGINKINYYILDKGAKLTYEMRDSVVWIIAEQWIYVMAVSTIYDPSLNLLHLNWFISF